MADERRVWIAQCLCPDRHCILAAADEAETEQEAIGIRTRLHDQVVSLVRSGAINPWCGLCNAAQSTWHFEVGRTRWRTMAEALPAMRAEELKQAVTSVVFGDLHKGKPN